MSRKKDLRIGVIGIGGRGRMADLAHRPGNGSRLVAGVDLKPAEREGFLTRFGTDAFVTDDYRKLLAREDIDAVFITTPDFLHEKHAVAALQSGKAVYLEKPMAITIAGCDRILRTAYGQKVRLYVGHNMRHMRFVQKMRELVRKGAIGQIKAAWCRHFIAYGGDAYFKDWHADRSKTTGLLLQKGAHDIDVMHWICGGYTRRVTAMGALTLYNQVKDRHAPNEPGNPAFCADNWPPLSQKGLNPVMDVEDLSMALMELDNGVFASYQQCHYTPDSGRNYTFIGTAGRIENTVEPSGQHVIRLWNHRAENNPQGDERHYIPPSSVGHDGADPEIIGEFLRYARSGGKVKTSPVAARNAVAAGCMATESLRNNATPRDIPPLPKRLVEYFDKDVAL